MHRQTCRQRNFPKNKFIAGRWAWAGHIEKKFWPAKHRGLLHGSSQTVSSFQRFGLALAVAWVFLFLAEHGWDDIWRGGTRTLGFEFTKAMGSRRPLP